MGHHCPRNSSKLDSTGEPRTINRSSTPLATVPEVRKVGEAGFDGKSGRKGRNFGVLTLQPERARDGRQNDYLVSQEAPGAQWGSESLVVAADDVSPEVRMRAR